MTEQPTCLCRREKEIDRLFGEFEDLRKDVSGKMTTTTFWTIIGLFVTIVVAATGWHILADAKEFDSFQEQINKIRVSSDDNEKVQIRIEVQLAEIQKQLAQINSRLAAIK